MLEECAVLALLVPLVITIPVDNGVEGDPEIECGATSITINFNTEKAFEGHVYVKGLYNEPGCRNDENGRQVAGITLQFDTCNLARTRSLNPRGIFLSTVVVITFHPNFITKVDRAYRIQCFYMEADKTVSADLVVSDLTTAFYSQLVPMPVCRYEILLNGAEGEPVAFAEIGQQVYHKWTCDTETTDTFCMVVHSCFVDDGNGDIVNILNEDGCALDRYVLNNLEYPSDLLAGQEAHVYKYADRSQLFYQCQITITIKEPGGDCPHPQCPESPRIAAGASEARVTALAGAATTVIPKQRVSTVSSSINETYPLTSTVSAATSASERRKARRVVPHFERRKRNAQWQQSSASTMDVRTELNAFDILEQGSQHVSTPLRHDSRKVFLRRKSVEDSSFCIYNKTLLIVIAAPASLFAVALLSSYYMIYHRAKTHAKAAA